MKEILSFILITMIINFSANAQELDKFKLSKDKFPRKCKETQKINPFYMHAKMLYDEHRIIASNLPEVDYKTYQSIKSGSDKGTIIVMKFKDDFKEEDWLKGFLYGPNIKKPTYAHPYEIIIKGDILIILAFKQESKLKEYYKQEVLNRIQ